jgi:uncharacterized protein
MQITIPDLQQQPLEFDLTLPPGSIDYGDDIHQIGDFKTVGRADLLEEHRGPRDIVSDIRVRANYEAIFEVPCARCVDPVRHPIAGDFDLLFRPLGTDSEASEHAISTSETEIGYYQDDCLALEDVLREQVLLSLPARTLCREECKGICVHCGSNLNQEPCQCQSAPVDPRWSALGELRSKVKQ